MKYLVATALKKKGKRFEVTTLWSQIRTECEKILKWVQLLNEETKDPESGQPLIFIPEQNILYHRGTFSITAEEYRERRHPRACVFRSSAGQL